MKLSDSQETSSAQNIYVVRLKGQQLYGFYLELVFNSDGGIIRKIEENAVQFETTSVLIRVCT